MADSGLRWMVEGGNVGGLGGLKDDDDDISDRFTRECVSVSAVLVSSPTEESQGASWASSNGVLTSYLTRDSSKRGLGDVHRALLEEGIAVDSGK